MLDRLVYLTLVISYFSPIFTNGEGIIVSNPLREERSRSALFGSVQGVAAKNILQRGYVHDDIECMHQCLSHPTCQSINYQTTGSPKHLCELSQTAVLSSPLCQEPRAGYKYYYSIKDKPTCVSEKTCKNGGSCAPACSAQVCQCQLFNKGKYCELWTTDVASCKDIQSKTSYRQDMAYTFVIDGKQTDIYCHMSSVCGSAGWTMVMKINGFNTTRFGYSSNLWTNKFSYNLTAGQSGFDNYQTKMASYWAMPFTKLCVGMRVGQHLRWLLISYSASSLHAVIANTTFRPLSVDRANWLSLINGASLQPNCNREGFNNGRSRIGIMANQENNCDTPDSTIGFGVISGFALSCGNKCSLNCNNGVKTTKAFCYILLK